MSIRIIAFSRFVILLGLALWLSIAVCNNLTDPGTNRLLLGYTLSMELLKAEEVLGAGLIWRAWSADWTPAVLYVVVAIQIAIALMLWRAVVAYAWAGIRNDPHLLDLARPRAILALSCFVLLWMWFLCGGLWFGYWLKQGAVQSVHMTLTLIGLGALLFVQGEPAPMRLDDARRVVNNGLEGPDISGRNLPRL